MVAGAITTAETAAAVAAATERGVGATGVAAAGVGEEAGMEVSRATRRRLWVTSVEGRRQMQQQTPGGNSSSDC
jgi:hypothetical protein